MCSGFHAPIQITLISLAERVFKSPNHPIKKGVKSDLVCRDIGVWDSKGGTVSDVWSQWGLLYQANLPHTRPKTGPKII